MPSYDSRDGVWTPKTEKVALVDKETGEPFIYEGPDRAATEYLKSQGVESLGVLFYKDPEIIIRARQLNMSVEEFCELHMNTPEKRDAYFKERHSKKQLHRPEPRKQGSKFESGGKDTAGSNHMEGKLSDLPANVPSGIAKQKLN